jgi:hypothetical protein
MISLRATKERMMRDPGHWQVPLMDFVDDFRRRRNPAAMAESPVLDHERWDALLAATALSLCREAGLEPPAWAWEVPPCRHPWFVSGMESLKAVALVESPLPFRLKKIFVLENFLSRV